VPLMNEERRVRTRCRGFGHECVVRTERAEMNGDDK
jgi:hypothetical protein